MKYLILCSLLLCVACQPGAKKQQTVRTAPDPAFLQATPNAAEIAGVSLYDLGQNMSDGSVDIYDPVLPGAEASVPSTLPVANLEAAEIESAPLPPASFNDDPVQRNNPDGSDYRQRPLLTY